MCVCVCKSGEPKNRRTNISAVGGRMLKKSAEVFSSRQQQPNKHSLDVYEEKEPLNLTAWMSLKSFDGKATSGASNKTSQKEKKRKKILKKGETL